MPGFGSDPLDKRSEPLALQEATLMVGLIVGHFGGIGRWSLRPSGRLLTVMREAGLMLFLAGAGIAGVKGL